MKTDFLPCIGSDSNDDLESWSLGDDSEELESISYDRKKGDWVQEVADKLNEDDCDMDEADDVALNGNIIKQHSIQNVNLLGHEEGGISCMGKDEAWAADETQNNKVNDSTPEWVSDSFEKSKVAINACGGGGKGSHKDTSGSSEKLRAAFNACDGGREESHKDLSDSSGKSKAAFNACGGGGEWSHKDALKQTLNPTVEFNILDGLDAQSPIGPANPSSIGPNDDDEEIQPLKLTPHFNTEEKDSIETI
ncbi:hypothetical protein SLA2020_245300 [Shorea laevis]